MKGFTLVEIILAMTLLGITVVATSVLMGRGLDAYNLVNSRTVALDQANYALVRMEKEMTKVSNINNAHSTLFAFVDSLGNSTDFHLDGTTLFRGNDPLAHNVSSLTFTFYRDNGATTTAPPQIRRIHIDMTVLADGGNGTIDLRTDVFPRIFIYDNFQ